MEVIPILYRIADEGGDSAGSPGTSQAVNCFELHVEKLKEVLLLDILQAWQRCQHPLGLQFKFYARAGDQKMVLLESPTCCVPVVNDSIYLILKRCSYVPFTPVEQSISWFEKSQRDVYGSSNINIHDRYRFQQSNRQNKRASQSQRASHHSSHHLSARESLKKVLSLKKTHHAKEDEPERYTDDREDHHEAYHHDWHGHRHSDERDHDYDRGGYDKDELKANIQDATKATVAAAGTAAKSFFSFASNTIKTVASVTAQGLEAGSELATAGLGIAAMSISGSIQVGSFKVSVVKDIAEGGFGKVALVKDTMTGSEYGKEYALKILLCQTKEQVKDAQNEIHILRTFNGHPNIIRLMDQSSVQKNNGQMFYLLFPMYHMGTAWDLIEKHSNEGGEGRWPFSEIQCLDIILGTVRALGAMHDAKFLHMDMKPHNILLTDSLESVIMDMGSAGHSDVQISSRRDALNLEDEAATKCSGPYRAPELYQVPQDFLMGGWIDIWSLGCTMHCLAFGWSPFENAREGVLKLAILNGRYTTPARNFNCGVTFSSGYVDLVKAMLQVDYTMRPTAQDVKERVKELIDDIENR